MCQTVKSNGPQETSTLLREGAGNGMSGFISWIKQKVLSNPSYQETMSTLWLNRPRKFIISRTRAKL